MKRLRELLHLRPSDTDETLDRADRVLENVKAVQIKVVPKNARALAELRRLDAQARR